MAIKVQFYNIAPEGAILQNTWNGHMAQLVARFPCKEEVSGSIPDVSIV